LLPRDNPALRALVAQRPIDKTAIAGVCSYEITYALFRLFDREIMLMKGLRVSRRKLLQVLDADECFGLLARGNTRALTFDEFDEFFRRSRVNVEKDEIIRIIRRLDSDDDAVVTKKDLLHYVLDTPSGGDVIGKERLDRTRRDQLEREALIAEKLAASAGILPAPPVKNQTLKEVYSTYGVGSTLKSTGEPGRRQETLEELKYDKGATFLVAMLNVFVSFHNKLREARRVLENDVDYDPAAIFRFFDVMRRESISLGELRDGLEELGYKPTVMELDRFFNKNVKNIINRWTFDEFLQVFPVQSGKVKEIRKFYAHLMKDSESGGIDELPKELRAKFRKVLSLLVDLETALDEETRNVRPSDIITAFETLDRDSDGVIKAADIDSFANSRIVGGVSASDLDAFMMKYGRETLKGFEISLTEWVTAFGGGKTSRV
jgi:Ca2+-binding EF-hand superfamily protein